MSDNSLIPISDEQAEAVKEIAKFGQVTLDVVGRPIMDGVGKVLKPFGSAFDALDLWIKRTTQARAETTLLDAIEKAEARGTPRESLDPSPRDMAEILQGAAMETDPDLSGMWSDLLATAMQPDRKRYYRPEYTDVLKKISPIDALILRNIYICEVRAIDVDRRIEHLRMETGLDYDEMRVSIDKLADLNCTQRNFLSQGVANKPMLSPFGKRFMAALNSQ